MALFTPDHLATILLIAIAAALISNERNHYGTYLTPIALMAVPYTVLVSMVNFVAIFFGYYTISLKANLLVAFFFMLFFFVGLIIRGMSSIDHGAIQDTEQLTFLEKAAKYQSFYRWVAIIALVAGFLQFRRVIGQVGVMNMGTPQFKELYGGGVFGHIMLISRPAFFFLFACTVKRWNWTNVIILLSVFAMVLAPQIKYQIIILIMGAVIFSINQGVIKVTLKKTILATAAAYFLFNVSYVIGFSASGLDYAYSDKVQAFLFNHFFTYLFGGPVGFSEVLKLNDYPYYSVQELFAVPLNIYKAIIGDSQYVEIIIRHWIPISTITQYFNATNTFGLFGMLYAYSGVAGAGIIITMYAAFAYSIFTASIVRRNNLAFNLAYSYLGSYLVLSFFGLYLNMLPFYEVFVYILILQYSIQGFQNLNAYNHELLEKMRLGDSNLMLDQPQKGN